MKFEMKGATLELGLKQKDEAKVLKNRRCSEESARFYIIKRDSLLLFLSKIIYRVNFFQTLSSYEITGFTAIEEGKQ